MPDVRRKHKRFKPQEGTFVSLPPPSSKLGETLDISAGGLAFRYIDTGERIGEAFELDIFLKDTDFYLEKVPAISVSDLDMAKEFQFSITKARRHSVQFGDLTQSQTFHLEYFIRHYTIDQEQ